MKKRHQVLADPFSFLSPSQCHWYFLCNTLLTSKSQQKKCGEIFETYDIVYSRVLSIYLWVDFAFFCQAELKPACILLLVNTFSHAQIYYLYRTSFILLFSQRTICTLKTFSEIEGQQAYLRRKDYFDLFSVAQIIIVIVFFIFNYIVLFSSALWKFLFFIRNNFLGANFPFHSLWSRERQLPAMTSKQLTLPVAVVL